MQLFILYKRPEIAQSIAASAQPVLLAFPDYRPLRAAPTALCEARKL